MRVWRQKLEKRGRGQGGIDAVSEPGPPSRTYFQENRVYPQLLVCKTQRCEHGRNFGVFGIGR